MSNTKEIRVIGFITNEIKDVCGPVPENYLDGEKDIPFKLIEEMKSNGWEDSNGVLWWDKDFQPEPVMGEDGNVYLCLSDEDMKDTSRIVERMIRSQQMIQ
jgi:hypothetical protein